MYWDLKGFITAASISMLQPGMDLLGEGPWAEKVQGGQISVSTINVSSNKVKTIVINQANLQKIYLALQLC